MRQTKSIQVFVNKNARAFYMENLYNISHVKNVHLNIFACNICENFNDSKFKLLVCHYNSLISIQEVLMYKNTNGLYVISIQM